MRFTNGKKLFFDTFKHCIILDENTRVDQSKDNYYIELLNNLHCKNIKTIKNDFDHLQNN